MKIVLHRGDFAGLNEGGTPDLDNAARERQGGNVCWILRVVQLITKIFTPLLSDAVRAGLHLVDQKNLVLLVRRAADAFKDVQI